MESADSLRAETIEKLKDLVRINVDTAEGLKAVVDELNAPTLKHLFREVASEREHLAVQLRGHLLMNDEEMALEESLAGRMHRWWASFKATVSNEDATILADAERAEDRILGAYRDALMETAGSPLNALLLDHTRIIKERHDQIRSMRDRAQRAAKA